jgi:hypothetical protein
VTIAGNYVGTNASLSAPSRNKTGIKICDGCTANLGVSGVGNVVSGNTASGIVLAGDSSAVAAHYIGTAGSGTWPSPTPPASRSTRPRSSNTIGGPSPAHMNYIGGNSQNGILIQGDDNTVDNNLIGIAAGRRHPARERRQRRAHREHRLAQLHRHVPGNKIAYNVNDGVTVAGTGIGNVVRRGKIAGNVNRGIDLGDDGTTTNDATDADTGREQPPELPHCRRGEVQRGEHRREGVAQFERRRERELLPLRRVQGRRLVPAQGVEYLGNNGCVAGNVFANYLFSVPPARSSPGTTSSPPPRHTATPRCNTPSEGTSRVLRVDARQRPHSLDRRHRQLGDLGQLESPPSSRRPSTTRTSTTAAPTTVTINSLVNVASVHVGGGVTARRASPSR